MVCALKPEGGARREVLVDQRIPRGRCDNSGTHNRRHSFFRHDLEFTSPLKRLQNLRSRDMRING